VRFGFGLAVFIAFTMAASSAASTERSQPLSLAFWDAEHGLISTVDWGSCGTGFNCTGSIQTTRDGGRSWRTTWRGNVVRNVVAVPGTRIAWATVEPKHTCGTRLLSPCATQLLVSRDGGQHWAPRRSVVEVPSIPSRLVAYAFRSGNTWRLKRTVNGGRTWSTLKGPCPLADGVATSFASKHRGWVVCTAQAAMGSQPKSIYETVDAARSWKLVANGSWKRSRGGLSVFGYPAGISFTSKGRGLLWEARGGLYLTEDGGRHWKGTAGTAPERREGISGWFASKRQAFLLLQDDPARRYELLRSDDGGRSWHVIRSWLR
jgi:photosystem II stability/assembly factor-like uncharacterized protein